MFVEFTEEKLVYIYISIYIYLLHIYIYYIFIYSCVKILEVLELKCLFTHTGFHDFIATQSQLFWFVLLNKKYLLKEQKDANKSSKLDQIWKNQKSKFLLHIWNNNFEKLILFSIQKAFPNQTLEFYTQGFTQAL